jgi:RHS repeat-associated protein
VNSHLGDPNRTVTARPKAALNWILFDEQFKVVSSSVGFRKLTVDAGVVQDLNELEIEMEKSGYLHVYCSNERSVDVFFDNIQVVHERSKVLEETHYYPFGGKLAGICSQALKSNYAVNKRLFNGGNELQSQEFSDGSGLELYDAQYRMYDPQIGRFNRIDPLADFYDDLTPYNFAFNNPILFNDPYGLSPQSENGSQVYTGYFRRTDGTIYFDPNVHDQKDLDPNSGLTYLGERLKATRSDGTVVWFDENGNSSTTDPGWENLSPVTVTGTRQKPRNFGFYLDAVENNYNGIKDNTELGVLGLSTIKKSTWNKNLYEFNKAYKYYNDVNLLKPGATSTKIVNGVKGAGKLVKRLGPVGNLLTAGNIAYEIKTDSWDAHTVIDGTLLVGTAVVATVAAAPVVAVVAVGVAIYGALDYFFDIGDKVDAAVGRKSGIW